MNPWLRIWKKPAAAIRAQAERDPARHTLLLATLHGLVVLSYLPFFYDSGAGILMGSAVALGLGSLIGWSVWQAKSWVVFWLGTKFGAAPRLDAIRCAVAWGFLPGIAGAAIWETIAAAGWVTPVTMLVIVLLFAGSSLWGVIVTVRACAGLIGIRPGQDTGFAIPAGATIIVIGFAAMLAKGVILNVSGVFVAALAEPPQFP